MNRIGEMIERLCPKGVKKVFVGDIIEYHTGGTLTRHQVKQEGLYPVMNGGTDYSGFYDSFNYDENVLTISHWGSSASHVHRYHKKFWANNACWIFTPKKQSNCSLGYLYYILKNKENIMASKYCFGGATPNLNRQLFERIEIPLPPLTIQREIVSVLDSFTTLIDKMKQEVELRKKQMEYYCDLLYGKDYEGMMALANIQGNSVVHFSELGPIERGRRFVRDDIRETGQPCIHYGDMYTYYGPKCDQTRTYLDKDFPKKMRYAQKGDVVIVGAGENDYDIGIGLAWMGDEPAAVHDACYILRHNLNPMYVSYYLRSNIYHQQLKRYVSSGKICSFSQKGLGKVLFPIQSDEKQRSIVSILDAFETYISKLEQLIALHEKQYAYYREKLLTFD